jgi:hypothetical protein
MQHDAHVDLAPPLGLTQPADAVQGGSSSRGGGRSTGATNPVVDVLMESFQGYDIISACVRAKWALPPYLHALHQPDIQATLDELQKRSRTLNATTKRRSRAQADQRSNPCTLSRYLTALHVWVGFVHSVGMQQQWLGQGCWCAPPLDVVAGSDGDFMYQLYKFMASDRYEATDFEASIETCCASVLPIISILAYLGNWNKDAHLRIRRAGMIGRHKLLQEAPHLNEIRNTKDAVSWEHVDLVMRALDRWPAVGHVFRSNLFKPVVAKALWSCLEYSGARPMCFLRCGSDCRDERFGEDCPFKLGQLTLYWPKSGGVNDLVVHGKLVRTKNGRDMPWRQDTAGVASDQVLGHVWLAPDAECVDRSPSHAMLVYLLARGAWPGYFQKSGDGRYSFVWCPPRTERDWQRTVQSVLEARPQQAWSGVRESPVFVGVPPGPDEHLHPGNAIPWLDEAVGGALIGAAAAALGMNGKLFSMYSARKSMATAAVNSKEPDLMKIIATTLKHMDLQTTLNHYVDFTYPKDSFSVINREDSRKDLPGPSGRLQHRITHGVGGLVGAVLQVARSDPVLERESLGVHLAGIAGTPTKGLPEAVHRRRVHIMNHTANALYREDASALTMLDPCASEAQPAREDDGWAQQLCGTPVSEYVVVG